MKNLYLSPYAVMVVVGLCLLACIFQRASAASISGTIRYEGNRVPQMKPIDMSKEEKCRTHYSEPPVNEMIVVGENNTFENVFVRVVGGLPDKEYPVPEEPVVLIQEGCRFHPHVTGVRANQPLKIVNSDGLLHNVNVKPNTMRPFNRAMPPAMKEFEHTFRKAEFPIEFKCDVHGWMRAYVGVMEHPFFP